MLQVDRAANQTGGSAPGFDPARRAVTICLGALTLVGVWASPSPLAVLASGIASICLVISLWRPGELPVLLLPLYVQFSAVALKPITTAFTNTPLEDLADFDANLVPAALFGLAGLAALAFGLRIGAGNARVLANDATIEGWSFGRILGVTLIAILIGHALDLVAERAGGARQIVLASSGIKWVGLFALAYSALRMRRGLRWLVLIVAIELVLGMSGFFSEFRVVLFVLLAAAIAAAQWPWQPGPIITIAVGAVLALSLAVFWSAVKAPYRDFLNQGTGAQVVLQPLDERLAFLVDEAIKFDGRQFALGYELLLARVSYIDFLATTMERVPEALPHEDGALLGAAVLHVLTPRILFPDKPELPSDTLLTAHYTGLENAIRADANTSISIGYLGELYIDFGVSGALVAVFLMGLACGRGYRAIRDYPRTPMLFNYGLCMMVALALSSFETSLIKVVGSFAMVLASALVLQRLIWPALLSSISVRASNRRSFGGGTEP